MLRLSEIEIYGFKSFAERTKMPLPGHLMAVVGPNGSGKSNVADAVLWALGEQSAKSLRGHKMQDVIFGGSHRRPASGMAEVFLSFEQSDGGQVRLGRRLMRSGESSYLMDGRPVRLKDIHDYLQRNGVSTQGTFLVEQGRVQALLDASPEERRIILEEVAGITHYKENRKSALQKLESTEANLLRLSDIIAEVETQMGALKKQAQKADRFVRLAEELDGKRKDYWGRSLSLISARKASIERDFAMLKEECGRRDVLLAARDSELEKAKGELASHETSLADLIQGIHVKDIERERLENENRRKTEQLLGGQGRLRQIAGDLGEIERRIAEAGAEGEACASERKAAEGEYERAKLEHQAALSGVEEAKMGLFSLGAAMEKVRAEAFDIAQESSRLQAGLVRLEEDIRKQEERIKRLEKECGEAGRKESEIEEALGDERKALAGAESFQETCKSELESAEQSLQAETIKVEDLSAALAQRKTELAAAAAKLDAVRKQGAALAPSADAFLEKRFPGLLTPTLASFLAEVPEHLVPPLRASYCALLDAHTGAGWDNLPDAFAALSGEVAGMATFLLGPQGVVDRENQAELIGVPGFIGWLPNIAGLPPQIASRLPAVALFQTPSQAKSFAEERAIPAVSSCGVFISGEGVVRGGAGGTGGAGLLDHEREKKLGEAEVKKATASVEKASASVSEAKLSKEASEKALASARGALASAVAEVHRLALEVQKLDQESKRIRTSKDLMEGELSQAREEKVEWANQCGELKLEIVEVSDKRAKNASAAREAEAAIALQREAQEKAHGELTGKAEALVRISEGLKAVALKEQNLRQRLDELAGTKARHIKETSEINDKNARLVQEITEGDRKLRELLLVLEEDRQKRSLFEERLAQLQLDRTECEHKSKEARDALGEVREDAMKMEVSLASADSEYRHIAERVSETFQEPLDQVAAQFSSFPPMSDEEREAAQKHLHRLEERKQEIGAVNLLAREEHRELEGRFEFLSGQKKDLDEAISSLQETIRKINKTTRERFTEAFEAVQVHFSHLFKEVFDGGEGRLSLLDDADPLETGVEIYAQPPGKKLQNMSLLSGGEKAKVALALLFSLFKYKPHPFFILDEVDAPLDEANINRFNKLLGHFKEQTQFLVISHNKRTMELADILYGITMVEGGVSRVVSVHLDGAEREISPEEG